MNTTDGCMEVSDEKDKQRCNLSSYLCTSAFLLFPIMRGDSNILRLIMDYMNNVPVAHLWLSSPCTPSTCGGDVPDRTLLSKCTICFQEWFDNGNSRHLDQLLNVSHMVFSPIAAACLRNEPYLLKLMLQKHWCDRNTSIELTMNESGCSIPTEKYLYFGINPLTCCLLSGSVACVEILLEHFGDHFSNLCNFKDDLNLLPLHTLMLLLRTKLKRRLFLSAKMAQADKFDNFYHTALQCYSVISPKREDIKRILGIMLPFVDFDMGHDWQDYKVVVENKSNLKHKIEKLKELRVELEDSVDLTMMKSCKDAVVNDEILFSTTVSLQQWEYIQWFINTDAFVNSLRVLATVLCKKTNKDTVNAMSLGNATDEIRMNRRFQNITRVVVLLLKYNKESTIPSMRTNWWQELDSLVNNDFKKNWCKLGCLMMNMRHVKLADDVFFRVKEYIELTEKWLQQGNSFLPARKANCTFINNCYVALDVLHKWSLLVFQDNARYRHQHYDFIRSEKERLLLDDDLVGLDFVMEKLQSYSQRSSSSPLMALLGEEDNPIGFDIAIFSASSLFSVNSDASHTSCMIGENCSELESVTSTITKCVSDDVKALCDDVITILLEDDRISQAFSCDVPHVFVPDLCGLSPLLGMCTYELWNSFEKATIAHRYINKVTQGAFIDKYSWFLFPGGVKSYLKSVRKSDIRSGSEFRKLVCEWDAKHIPFYSENSKSCLQYPPANFADHLQVVDVLNISLLKRQNNIVMRLLEQPIFSFRNVVDVMIFAFVTNNAPLCVKVALECANTNYVPSPISTVKILSYLSLNDIISVGSDDMRNNSVGPLKRFANRVNDFSVGYRVKVNNPRTVEIEAFKVDGYAPLRDFPIEQCAARQLIEIYLSAQCEHKVVREGYTAQFYEFTKQMTTLQKHQQIAIKEYGFQPIYKGSLAGLCLSNDGEH